MITFLMLAKICHSRLAVKECLYLAHRAPSGYDEGNDMAEVARWHPGSVRASIKRNG